MSTIHLVPSDIKAMYRVYEWRNATGILTTAYPNEWQDVLDCLRAFTLPKSLILKAGKNKSDLANALDGPLKKRGWIEKKFNTAIKIDDSLIESPTHKIDCYKNRVALEVEWNNKDPFYDRDLNNFRLLFELRVIDVGIIITRTSELQKIFDDLGKGASYGQSTAHLGKLLPKVEGGGGGGCPILVFGISPALYQEHK